MVAIAMTHRRLLPLLAVLAALLVPATASASSGSISGVGLAGPGTVAATFSVTSDYTGSSGYSGFFTYARVVPEDTPCAHGVGKAVWVSDDIAERAGTLKGSATFAMPADPFRICLWVYQADDREFAIAQSVHDPAALRAVPAAAAAPAPAAQGSPAPAGAPTVAASRQSVARTARRLTANATRLRVARALATKYGASYRKGKAKKITCKRSSATKFRCAVSWRQGRNRYKGTVTVTSTVTRGVRSTVSVKRSRVR